MTGVGSNRSVRSNVAGHGIQVQQQASNNGLPSTRERRLAGFSEATEWQQVADSESNTPLRQSGTNDEIERSRKRVSGSLYRNVARFCFFFSQLETTPQLP
jgi:hypothetical protein